MASEPIKISRLDYSAGPCEKGPGEKLDPGDKAFTHVAEPVCVFCLDDFPYARVEGEARAGVLIIGRPENGMLRLGALALQPGEFVRAADIAAGAFSYAPAHDFSGEDCFCLAVTNGAVFAAPQSVVIDVTTGDPSASADVKPAPARAPQVAGRDQTPKYGRVVRRRLAP